MFAINHHQIVGQQPVQLYLLRIDDVPEQVNWLLCPSASWAPPQHSGQVISCTGRKQTHQHNSCVISETGYLFSSPLQHIYVCISPDICCGFFIVVTLSISTLATHKNAMYDLYMWRHLYLGHLINISTYDGKCDEEIKRRVEIARTTFSDMSKVLTAKLNFLLKISLLKCYF